MTPPERRPRAFDGWSAAALIVFAVDGDVVADAFLKGSPGALWATLALIAGIAVCAIAWRRLRGVGLASVACAVTATFVAISGAVDGTLDDAHGLTATGIPPDVFASVAIAAALLAAVWIVAAARMPLVTLVAGAFAAYALATIAMPLVYRSGGFDAALALPPFFPEWLRGAFAGTVLAFAIAIVAALVAAVRRPALRGAAIAACIAFVAMLQAATFDAAVLGFATPLAFEAPPAAVPPRSAALALLAGYVPPADAGAPVASAAQRQTSVIAGIGDPPASAAPSETPQPVRGDAFEAGIAAGRASLSLADVDVAALAKTLPNDPAALDVAVRDAIALDIYPGIMRGATGTLVARAANDEDRAVFLAGLLAAKNVPVRFARAELSDAEVSELIARAKADRVDLIASPIDAAPLQASGIDLRASRINARISDDAAVARLRSDLARSRDIASSLLDAAASAGHAAQGDPSAAWPQLLRSHTWVQVQSPSGAWTDLDSSLPRLAPGTHLGTTATVLPTLPPGDAWLVTARLVEDAGTAPQTFVTATGPAADLTGKYVVARFVPVGAEDPAKFENATTYRPEILGALAAQGQPFDASTLANVKALRLEIDVSAPGGAITTYRRTLAAEIPSQPLARAAAVAQQVAFVVTPGALNQTFVMKRWLAAVHAVRPQLAKLAGYAGTLSFPIAKDASLYPYALADLASRDDAAALALARDGTRMWRDRPGIYLERSYVLPDGSQRRMVREFDIVENGMAAAGANAALANATRGVYATHAEQTLDSAQTRTGMLQVASAAQTNGAKLVVLASAADRAKLAGVDAASTGNLDETFAHHQIALAYDRTSTVDGRNVYGWWALDGGGNLVGRLTGGGGQESEENIIAEAVPELVMDGWDVNQITGSCFGEGATTTSCGGEICDSLSGDHAEAILGSAFNSATQKGLGFTIGAVTGFQSKMLGKIAGELATSNTSGNLCGAAFGAIYGPPTSLAF